MLIVGRDQHAPFAGVEVTALSHLAGVLAALVVRRAGSGELAAADVDASDDLAVVVGMVEERLHTTATEAMTRLRARAFADGCTIHDLARAVLAGRTDLADIAD